MAKQFDHISDLHRDFINAQTIFFGATAADLLQANRMTMMWCKRLVGRASRFTTIPALVTLSNNGPMMVVRRA